MVTRDLLTGTFRQGEVAVIYNAIKEYGDFLAFMQNYLYDEDIRVVRKALWGVTHATNDELSLLRPMLNELIDFAMSCQDTSARRMTMNIIERLPFTIDDLRSDFLDFCLEQMVNPNEPSAIQAMAMKLASRMCGYYPELNEELLNTLDTMDMDYYSAGVKSVRNKILNTKI